MEMPGVHLGRYIDLYFIFNQRKYKTVSLIKEKLIKKNRKWYNRSGTKIAARTADEKVRPAIGYEVAVSQYI